MANAAARAAMRPAKVLLPMARQNRKPVAPVIAKLPATPTARGMVNLAAKATNLAVIVLPAMLRSRTANHAAPIPKASLSEIKEPGTRAIREAPSAERCAPLRRGAAAPSMTPDVSF